MSNQLTLGDNLTIEDGYQMIHDIKISLSSTARDEIKTCRDTLEEINDRQEPVYGVSTGFGHLENKWINKDQQKQLQTNLIRSHAIGRGEEIPLNITRTAMILLVNSLAKGNSGIRIETVDLLIELINNNIIPQTYRIGSLGASGDLAPLAHVALVLIGEGKAYYEGELYQSSTILSELGLTPIKLEAKEGLALINGTHFMTAYSLHLLSRGKDIISHSLIAASLSIEALRATDKPFWEKIANVRPHPGHRIVSKIMRDLLEDSKIIKSHRDPRIDHKTQDQYALRCIPQVIGGIWDAFSYLERTIQIELNSVTDNPLIFKEDDTIVSGGNFHGEPLGFPLESVCLAMVELANISEARISRLVSPHTPELPAFLASSPGIESGYMIAHYSAAAIVNKLRGMAHPNISDNIPVSGNQEDHVSMVMNSATRAWDILELVEEVIAFELLMAVRGLNLVEHPESSRALENVLDKFNQQIPFKENDHVIYNLIDETLELIHEGSLLNIISVSIPSSFCSPKNK